MSQTNNCIEYQDIDALMTSLDALQPAAERATSTKFTALYASIERALARGVTQRAVMEALERDGLKLHPAKFKKLLDEARAQRNESGESIRCASCGCVQTMPSPNESLPDEGDKK